jgi:hypothetical protein
MIILMNSDEIIFRNFIVPIMVCLQAMHCRLAGPWLMMHATQASMARAMLRRLAWPVITNL